jgi:hypothetical protein
MSGQPYKNPLDVAKFRNEYLANLALEVKNNDLNLQANKVYIRTGAPSQPTDTRTTSEKLADLYRLRIDIRSKLGEIMSGDNAQKVVDGLDENEARFLAQQIGTIVADLKPKFALGVPADVFNPYFQKYMRKYLETQGVDYGLQQESGRQLLANQQTIMNTIVSAQDIRDIKDSLELLGLQNTLLGKKIETNLKETLNAIDTSIEAFRLIAQTNNPILKEEILRDVNLLVNELPTRNEIQVLVDRLRIAQEKGDEEVIVSVLKRIDELTSYDESMKPIIEQLKTPKTTPLKISRTPGLGGKIDWDPSLSIESYEDWNSLTSGGKRKFLKSRVDAGELRISKKIIKDAKTVNPDELTPIFTSWLTSKPSGKTKLPPTAELPVVEGIMSGKGLSAKVDYSAGIGAEPDYVPFGKFLINRKKLVDGVVMIKRHGGQFLPDMKTRRVSPNLTVVFKKIAGGALPSFSELEKLDDDERQYLKFVANKSNLSSKLDVPSPKKDKDEELINQFEVMRGQMIAGNDSKDLFRKFKQILVTMLDRDLIPKGQVREILLEMSRREI